MFIGSGNQSPKASPAQPVECPHCGGMTAADSGAVPAFSLQYLPDSVASSFGEALACYRHGLWKAFAAMCRLSADAVFADLGESGRLTLFNLAQEVQSLGEISDQDFAFVRQTIFGPDSANRPLPAINRHQAALLLETMKDTLHQIYVRRARLQQALRVRRFFAEQRAEADCGTS